MRRWPGRIHNRQAAYPAYPSQWFAAEEWASGHAGDSDVEEVLKRVRGGKAAYLRWGRETLDWAIYVFKKGALVSSSAA